MKNGWGLSKQAEKACSGPLVPRRWQPSLGLAVYALTGKVHRALLAPPGRHRFDPGVLAAPLPVGARARRLGAGCAQPCAAVAASGLASRARRGRQREVAVVCVVVGLCQARG